MVKKAQFVQRLGLTSEEPTATIGTYFLARYCTEQKQYEKAEKLFTKLLNNEELLNSSMKARFRLELNELQVKKATELLQPWHDKPPSKKRTEVAQKVFSIIRPVVHHLPTVSNWATAYKTYTDALRCLDTKSSKEEGIKFVDHCIAAEMSDEQRDTAILEVVGLLKGYSGYGIAFKKSEHLRIAKKLSQDVLSRKKEPKERWGLALSIADLQASLREYDEADDTIEQAVEEMPQFLNTAAYYQQKAAIFVHQGDYKNGVATLEKALKLKLNSDERAYIKRTLLEYRSFGSLIHK